MILTLVEENKGTLSDFSKQALTFAREIASQSGAPLQAVLIGGDANALAPEIARYGAGDVHHIRHDILENYSPQAWSKALTQLVESKKPQGLVAPGSLRGNEILTLVGARLALPLSTNSIAVKVNGDSWEISRNCWAGSLNEKSVYSDDLKLLTLAPLILEESASETSPNSITEFSPELSDGDVGVRLSKIEKSAEEGKSLGNATLVIGGGRGVGSAEGFSVLNELAEVTGGVVGGSRVTTNNGWVPHRQQIGLTGTRIAPQLYIACGISGAIQHLSGCKSSKNILVINKDRDAPFFNKANYGVIGDLHEVIPAVIEELKK